MCERMVEGVEGLFPVGGFKLTFPDSNAMPSHVSKPFLLLNVPFPVAVYLPLPEVDICFRHPEEAASLVAVPEAAVDKDHRMVFAQHDVGMSGQTWVVQPEPVTMSEEKSSYCQFRFGVLAAYGSHVVVPLAVG